MSSKRTDGRNCFAFPSCCSSSFASIDSSLQDVARTTCEKRDKMEDRSIFATTDFCTWLPINAVKRLGYAALWQRALQHPLHPGPQRGTLSAACIHLVDSWPFLLDGTGGFCLDCDFSQVLATFIFLQCCWRGCTSQLLSCSVDFGLSACRREPAALTDEEAGTGNRGMFAWIPQHVLRSLTFTSALSGSTFRPNLQEDSGMSGREVHVPQRSFTIKVRLC